VRFYSDYYSYWHPFWQKEETKKVKREKGVSISLIKTPFYSKYLIFAIKL